jgi:hypothetical protein
MIKDSIKIERSATERARRRALTIRALSKSRSEIGRDQELSASAGDKLLPRLIKQRNDVSVIRTGMPCAVGDIPRLARGGSI